MKNQNENQDESLAGVSKYGEIGDVGR
jgi:hypothetical protein